MHDSLPYIMGTSAVVIAVLFSIIAMWFKSLLNKVEMLPSLVKDVEYLMKGFQELKIPLKKLEDLDRQLIIIDRDLKTAFRHIDAIRDSFKELRGEIYELRIRRDS